MGGIFQVMKQAAILRHAALVYAMYGHNTAACEVAMKRHLNFVDDVYEGLWAVATRPPWRWSLS